jgi:hypothetical protein
LLLNYTPDNIYNADETGLYFRALPDSTYVEKELRNQSCGIKTVKDRITVLICCSMTEVKKQPLIIGKARNPQCFKNIHFFPVEYEYSLNAWMTSKI